MIAADGGYNHLAMCLHGENGVPVLNEQGIAVFGLKYRSRYGNNDVAADALADGKRAVRIKHSPPTFLAHAQDDKTAPIEFAMEVHKKLRGLGVPDEMFVVDAGGHGAFHVGMVEGPGAKWPDALFRWLRKLARC